MDKPENKEPGKAKGSAKQKFSYDSIQDISSVKKYLKTLIQSLEKREITLFSDDDAIELTPAELLHFTIEARKKGRKNKVSFELQWNDNKTPGKNRDKPEGSSS